MPLGVLEYMIICLHLWYEIMFTTIQDYNKDDIEIIMLVVRLTWKKINQSIFLMFQEASNFWVLINWRLIMKNWTNQRSLEWTKDHSSEAKLDKLLILNDVVQSTAVCYQNLRKIQCQFIISGVTK